jgi:UDP-2,3-diacylglucosamine hydrolase
MNNNRIALIAGEGILPEILAQRLNEKKLLCLILVLQGGRERFNSLLDPVYESAPGKIKTIIKILRNNKINKVVIIGKIDKRAFIERKGFDLKALQLLKKLKNGNDMSIFKIIQNELNNIGIEILPQDIYLKDMIVHKGIITKTKPKKKEITDSEYGIHYAKQLASMDIGQAIVIKNMVITAVEAIEGTNETIKRGALLADNGSVVCKAARSNQDNKFDIPTIGLETLKIMTEYKCSVLALEADSIFIVNPAEVIDYADSKQISIIGI